MSGVLGIWHDVVPGAEADVEAWYDREHHAERVAIPGFRRARRHRGLQGGPLVFGRYDVDGPEVLQSAPYLAALQAPGPWTRRMMPLYRNMCRVVFRRTARIGTGEGGFVVSFRLAQGTPDAGALLERIARDMLPAVVATPFVLSAETWLADELATRPADSAEVVLRGRPDAMIPGAVVVEGTEPNALRDAVAPLRTALVGAEEGLHQLVFSLSSGRAP